MASKVQVDPNFNDFAEDLQEWSRKAAAAEAEGERIVWFRPRDLERLDDYDAMLAPFDRSQVNQQGQLAMDSQDPGVTGDLIAANAQIEYLATAGRAFMHRHAGGPVRAFAHLAALNFGLGRPDGPIAQNAREYVNATLAGAAAAEAG